jgi:myo-inositol catabolism protein IolS
LRYTQLGRTDIQVSVVCCGTMAMSSDGTFGAQDDAESVRTVHAALDAGISFFDTAESYGDGHAEEVLGRALEGLRGRAIIATKVSEVHLRRADLLRACEASLRRLRTDCVDVYQVHWPNRSVPFGEVVAALEGLKATGKVRAWGVSNFGKADLDAALAAGRPEVNQLPYSLLWRAIERDILPLCVRHSMSVLCYSPLAQGLLTGKFRGPEDVPPQRKRARYCKEPAVGHAFALLDEVRALSTELERPMADVALAWLLAQQGVASVVAGMRTPEQARENARAGDLELPADAVARLTAASTPLHEILGANPDMWREGADSRYR